MMMSSGFNVGCGLPRRSRIQFAIQYASVPVPEDSAKGSSMKTWAQNSASASASSRTAERIINPSPRSLSTFFGDLSVMTASTVGEIDSVLIHDRIELRRKRRHLFVVRLHRVAGRAHVEAGPVHCVANGYRVRDEEERIEDR